MLDEKNRPGKKNNTSMWNHKEKLLNIQRKRGTDRQNKSGTRGRGDGRNCEAIGHRADS